MPTKIKRGQSLLIPFKNGMTIYDSQNKPRMYLTQKAFEKSFPGHLIDREGVELVEYAEVVRCKDCKFSIPLYQKDGSALGMTLHCRHGRGYQINASDREYSLISPNNFCGSGKRKMNAEVQDDA